MGNQISRKPIEWVVNGNGCFVCVSHSKDKTGYARYRANGKLTRLHVYVYEQMFGSKPKGFVVMHKCDNPTCINPEHLMLGTQKENVHDMINKNRKASLEGIRNPMVRLTEEQVIEILKDNRPQVEIAKRYGVKQAHISAIKLGKTWKHLHDMCIKGVS